MIGVSRFKDWKIFDNKIFKTHSEIVIQKFIREHKTYPTINETDETILRVINPVQILGQLCGCLPKHGYDPTNRNGKGFLGKIIQFIYPLIFLTQSTVILVLYILWLKTNLTEVRDTVGFCFVTTNFLANVYFLVITNKWKKVFVEWEEVEKRIQNFKPQSTHTALGKRIKMIIAVIIFISAVDTVLRNSEHLYDALICAETPIKHITLRDFPQFYTYFEFNYVNAVGTQIFSILLFLGWCFRDIFIISISICATELLKNINFRLKLIIERNTSDEYWEETRLNYERVRVLIANVDAALSPLLLLAFSNNLYYIFVLCLNIYRKPRNPVSGVYFWYCLLHQILRALALCLFASNVNDESKVPIKILQRVSKKVFNGEVKRFLAHINNNNIALSGYQFFYLTRQIILQITGTVITYELVLLQFNKNFDRSINSTQCN